MRTGTVGPDIPARDAAAGRALSPVFGGGFRNVRQQGKLFSLRSNGGQQFRIMRTEAGNERAVNTFVSDNALRAQINGFCAGSQFQPVRPGGVAFRNALRQREHFPVQRGAVSRIQPVQSACASAVHVHKAEDQLFRTGRKFPADAFHLVQNTLHCQLTSQNNGIKTPDDALWADHIRQTSETVQTPAQHREIRFQTFLLIVVERVLKIKLSTCGFDFR